MNKREQQRRERLNQILACGLDMIISRGYEATKIRNIAKELKISTGLFFNYFASKEQLYEELVKIGLSGPESVLSCIRLEELRPVERFEAMTQTIFHSLQTNSFTAKIFILMVQTMNSETIPDRVKRLVADFDVISPVIPVIRQGQEQGEMKIGDPAALAIAYWGAIQGIAEIIAMNPEMPLPESSWVVDILKS